MTPTPDSDSCKTEKMAPTPTSTPSKLKKNDSGFDSDSIKTKKQIRLHSKMYDFATSTLAPQPWF